MIFIPAKVVRNNSYDEEQLNHRQPSPQTARKCVAEQRAFVDLEHECAVAKRRARMRVEAR